MADLDYVYCPYCGVDMETRYIFGNNRRVCPLCGFTQFNDPKVAVIGLVTAGDKVLLVRRGVQPAMGQWALPGGYMDAGEMPRDALSRELYEEVGLKVQPGEFLDIYPFAKTSRVIGGIVIAYRVDLSSIIPPIVHAHDDVDAAAWFSKERLPDHIAFESSRELIRRWRADDLLPDHSIYS